MDERLQPIPMFIYIGSKRYATGSSTLIAHGQYTGGPDWLPNDKVSFLFRSQDGAYFAQHRAHPSLTGSHAVGQWVEALTEVAAVLMYWELGEQDVHYDEAFGLAGAPEA